MTTSLIVSLICIALIAALFIHKLREPSDKRNHWTIEQADFPTVHVHKETHSHAEAEALANLFRMIYRETWQVFVTLYEVGWRAEDKKHQAPIAKIGLNTGKEIEPAHKHIRWTLPDVLHIRYQPIMYFHFAGELHNMFRWNLHKCNMKIVKNPLPGKDASMAAKVQIWIDKKYGKGK